MKVDSLSNMPDGASHALFKDRTDAGKQLAARLTAYAGKPGLVLGLVRGGVITARETARALNLPLGALIVKKIPSPFNPEYAVGAVAPDGISVIHWTEAHRSGADEDYINSQVETIGTDIKRRMHEYRTAGKPVSPEGRTVIIADDGAATGATMEAAVLWARKKKARSIIVALPVASREAVQTIRPEVTDMAVVIESADLGAVGSFYASFDQVTDEEVLSLLRKV